MWPSSGRSAAAALRLLQPRRSGRVRLKLGPQWRRSCCGSGTPSGPASGPPWKVMFFGSDHFSLESLKLLTADSRRSGEKTVASLEVVALSDDVPVSAFARQHHLPVHHWPPQQVDGCFDVGVVVSFGRLLHKELIDKFPYGILNVHPSLLPRWRGPAPVVHTILQGDAVTGVTIMQIRPHRFDVGPILNQELHRVPDDCTAEELGAALATKGAHLLMDTLATLPQRMEQKIEQQEATASFAPKFSESMSWIQWEEQTCDHIQRLYRAIGSTIRLRTIYMGRTIKLLDFVGRSHISFSDPNRIPVPGSVTYQKESNTLAVRCQDGWVVFRTVLLRKRLSAEEFHNGHLHQHGESQRLFVSRKSGGVARHRTGNSAM